MKEKLNHTSKLYDATDPKSIEDYAKELVGYTFEEVAEWGRGTVQDRSNTYAQKSRKGGLGNFLEEQYFNYRANSDSEADFPDAGVELKVTPYEIKKSGKLSAGERLVLSMISYEQAVEPDFYKSHVWEKCRLILLIYYLRDKSLKSNMKYRIDFATLFTPPLKDMDIIIQDYKTIIGKIASGKANELSESDTMYLGACTKGSTAIKSTVPQAYYAPAVKARKRAFCFKNSYMTYVLNQYVVPEKENYESIVKNRDALKDQTFEEYVVSTINKHAGKTDRELCVEFNRKYDNNKSQWFDLAHRMLGIKSNKAEEFIKAQIVVKAIRIEENGKMRESSPLPNIVFKELATQKWEDSDLFCYFDETKFLYVVFRKKGDEYVLKGAQLWNMPYQDLNNVVREGWLNIQQVVKAGVVFSKKKQKNGIVISNNFPSKASNPIIHIRPHASKSYYVFEDGSVYGSGKISDSDELPDGRRMSKQSFWINNSYLLTQLDKSLVEE